MKSAFSYIYPRTSVPLLFALFLGDFAVILCVFRGTGIAVITRHENMTCSPELVRASGVYQGVRRTGFGFNSGASFSAARVGTDSAFIDPDDASLFDNVSERSFVGKRKSVSGAYTEKVVRVIHRVTVVVDVAVWN